MISNQLFSEKKAKQKKNKKKEILQTAISQTNSKNNVFSGSEDGNLQSVLMNEFFQIFHSTNCTKMKCLIKEFLRKCDQIPEKTADLVTFTL